MTQAMSSFQKLNQKRKYNQYLIGWVHHFSGKEKQFPEELLDNMFFDSLTHEQQGQANEALNSVEFLKRTFAREDHNLTWTTEEKQAFLQKHLERYTYEGSNGETKKGCIIGEFPILN